MNTKSVLLVGMTVLVCVVLASISSMTHTMAMTENEQAFGGFVGWLGPVAGAVWCLFAGFFFGLAVKE